MADGNYDNLKKRAIICENEGHKLDVNSFLSISQGSLVHKRVALNLTCVRCGRAGLAYVYINNSERGLIGQQPEWDTYDEADLHTYAMNLVAIQ